MTVRFTGSGPSGPHTRIRPQMIVVIQDTIEYADINLDIGQAGPVAVRIRNTHPMSDITLPFKLTGSSNVVFDSLVRTGLTSNWTLTKPFDNGNTQSVWRLRALTAGAPIPTGGGVVATLWARAISGSNGQVETIDSASYGASGQHTLRLQSEFAGFKPRFAAGSVSLGPPCDCTCHGDPVCEGATDVLDVVTVVNVAFRGGVDILDPGCPHAGRTDINCDCATDVVDVVVIVNHAFRGDISPLCSSCVFVCQ
jgi:hypothetical protein